LFCPGEGDAFQLEQGLWPEEDQVSASENEILAREFTEEEIKFALYQMEKNKVAWPDGFPIEFFQTCWNFVRLDIMAMFKNLHDKNLDIKRLNYGIICHDWPGLPQAQAQEWLGRGLTGHIRGAKPELPFIELLEFERGL
jgi:hypothetical protein